MGMHKFKILKNLRQMSINLFTTTVYTLPYDGAILTQISNDVPFS